MQSFTRGNLIQINCAFAPIPPVVGVPTSASITLSYPVAQGLVQNTTYSLTQNGAVWSCIWDSSVSVGGGPVFYAASCAGGLVATDQGLFRLEANPANK